MSKRIELRFQGPFHDELVSLGVDPKRPLAGLLRIAEDHDHPRQSGAIYFLGELRSTGSANVLTRVLYEALSRQVPNKLAFMPTESKLVGVAQQCIRSLGQLDIEESHAVLVDIFYESEFQYARQAAAEASGYEIRMSDPNILIEALQESEPLMRSAALHGIRAQVISGRVDPYVKALSAAVSDEHASCERKL